MKWINWSLNQWWFSWLDRWWLNAMVQVVGWTYILSWIFPNSGLHQLNRMMVSVLGYAVIFTGIALGSQWLWRRLRNTESA
jgi:hypothetical protein